MLAAYLATLANAFRGKLNTTEKINAQNFVEKINEVYDAGKQAECDDFWDSYLQSGNASVSHSYFAGGGWTFDNFKPKHDLIVSNAVNLFYLSVGLKGDLQNHLDNLIPKVKLDFSRAGVNFSTTFYGCNGLTRIGEINASNATRFNSMFGECTKLVTIDKIIITENCTQFNAPFINCNALKNITFDGVIGTDINFQYSPLSVASMKNIISCLKNYSNTTEEATHTVKFSSECWTALNKETDQPKGETWEEYVTDYLGWLI